MEKEYKSSRRGKIISASAAAVGYGGWAVYANSDHSMNMAISAGVIQGTYAFLSTILITIVAQKAYEKTKCGMRGICVGFLISFIVMLAIPLSIHNYFGTPNIWQTITPGLIWGSIYLITFLITLEVKQKKVKQRREQAS